MPTRPPRTPWAHLVALGLVGAAIHLGPLAVELADQPEAVASTPPPVPWAPALVNTPVVRPQTEHSTLDG